ncbi:hypothetical protein GGR28_000334 [Lewinella aquimaris]|uniref:Uncharacterized protein n=1 Tax=Neolewinella aquimaris TaxID=1835722 RepID=A0A840E1A0_9BACT|nr:hypothetical protein [Neolewinella aquimaris]MBB4077733.1 hypothetical protein [Neolewinella aquimaris]
MGAEAFIATCRQLGELDFSPDVARRALAAAEEELPVRYAMPFPPGPSPVFERGGRDMHNRRGQLHELVQHLTDLAYLTPSRFRQWHEWRQNGEGELSPVLLDAVLSAVGQFVSEDDYAPFGQVDQFPAADRTARLDWTERTLAILVHRAAALTSFDAELSPRPSYRIGERTAYGRSLAFRIRLYFHDFVDRRTDARKVYFDADLVPFLHTLDNSLGDPFHQWLPRREDHHLHPGLQALLLDARIVFEKFRERHRFLPDRRQPYFLVYDLDRPADRGADFLDRLSRRAGKKVAKNAFHQDTGNNRLGVRLLQLCLWRAGFYTGTLDGLFGRMSHDALLALIQQEREAGGTLKEHQLNRVCLPAGEGEDRLWVVDLRLAGMLLDAYMPPDEATANREEELIWDRIRREGKEAALDDQLAHRREEFKGPYGELHKYPDRRVYYGLRGLIRGAFRAIGRVVGWITGVVDDLLGAVFDFVKSVVKRIQEGIGCFLAGFRYFAHYLLGRPFVSLGQAVEGRHPVLLTKFVIDFDVVSFLDTSASGADRRAHTAYLKRMAEGVAFFLGTTVDIIRLVSKLTGTVGWLRLGILIARWVRAWLRGVPRSAAIA